MLPFASLLIELDVRTGRVDRDGHQPGRGAHVEACGVPYDVLAWTMEWYVREDTLREANTCIINHHHGLEPAGVFGGGTMSSSRRAAFPRARQVDHRPGDAHPRREGAVHLHPRVRPARHLRHQDPHPDPAGGPVRTR
ncbi:Tn3 family transposase [Nonomuraea guangzhouensis]|uniref:Tn3 family transposase n=1 Tax=Nonomuraea guangzhouensis TaxID=1291555 RepID=A0ABW4G7V8_9ACTN